MEIDDWGLLLKLAGIVLFGAGFIISAIADQRDNERRFVEWQRHEIEFSDSVGHPEWIPPEWRKEVKRGE